MKCRQRIFCSTKRLGARAAACLLALSILSGCAGDDAASSPASSDGAVSSAWTEEVSSLPEESAAAASSRPESVPEILDDPSIEPYWLNSLIVYGDMVLEPFQSSETAAANYAKVVSDIKQALGEVKVYNMVVPTHVEFALPERFRGAFSDSQRGTLDAVYNGYTADVAGVDIYDILSLKKREYLYFNTDHHWTGLAAYYAYTEFAKAAGFEPIAKEEMEKKSIPGLLGSLYDATGLETLKEHPDTVEYFRIPGDYACSSIRRGGTQLEPTMLLHEYAQGIYAYGVYLGGDTTLFVVRNQASDLQNKKKIAVIKESFGNAFAPYLAPHYSEVHIIDLRYFKENLASYVEENGIDEVLVINNIKAAASASMQNYLSGMIS